MNEDVIDKLWTELVENKTENGNSNKFKKSSKSSFPNKNRCWCGKEIPKEEYGCCEEHKKIARQQNP